MTELKGEVFDLGYQHYTGPREGRMRARKALWMDGVRTVLGLGRGPRAKILPILLFVCAMFPALILILMASQAGFGDKIVGHAGYYQTVSIIFFLFAAIMAPELLCPDRRDKVINLYLVRPLTTTDYVIGRWLAFFSITLAIVYLGQIILFVGLTLASTDPLNYLGGHWLDVPRFIAAGLVVALFTTTIPMAVAAFTTRRAYAVAFVIGLFLISGVVSSALTTYKQDYSGSYPPVKGDVEHREYTAGEAAKWFALIDIGSVPIHVNDMIFAEENNSRTAVLVEEFSAVVPILWYLFLTIGPGFLLWWRYRSIGI